jgi:hypothetical protein
MAGLGTVEIEAHGAELRAPSARWLAGRMGFAPGMASLLAGTGADRSRVLATFIERVEKEQGMGGVRFGGRAFVAVANVT